METDCRWRKEPVHEINGELLISIFVPEEYRAEGRQFAIAYVHGDESKVIEPVSYDNATGELIFKASEFSTYALIFKTVPQTSDNTVSMMLVVGMLILSGLGMAYFTKKREIM